MGAWGVGLYQDDVTCDVKEEYVNRLKVGMSNEEAMINIIECNIDYIKDEDDGPLFWMALADTQWKYGRLDSYVKDEALKAINNGLNLEGWKENNKLYEKRKQVLKELEIKLNSQQPPEKKISKLVLSKPNWDVGDVLAYQIKINNSKSSSSKYAEELLSSKWYNKYVLFRVVGVEENNVGSLPRDKYLNKNDILALYNWVGNDVPNLEIINKLKFAKTINLFNREVDNMCTIYFNKKELKNADFKVIMKDNNYKIPSINTLEITGLNAVNLPHSVIIDLNYENTRGTLIDET